MGMGRQLGLLWGAILVALLLSVLTQSGNDTVSDIAGVLLFLWVLIVIPAVCLGTLLLTIGVWS